MKTTKYPPCVTDMRITALGIIQTTNLKARREKIALFCKIYCANPETVVAGMSERAKKLCREAGNL